MRVCDSCAAWPQRRGIGRRGRTRRGQPRRRGRHSELRDRAFYAPAQSRYRIFIVDEAHMVTTAGFNALLKIVEEPPEHLIFVFATTEPEKVPTIRSRTHPPVPLLAPRTMRGLIGEDPRVRGCRVDDAVFRWSSGPGGGSPRDTLSVLDQLVAGADDRRVHYPRRWPCWRPTSPPSTMPWTRWPADDARGPVRRGSSR